MKTKFLFCLLITLCSISLQADDITTSNVGNKSLQRRYGSYLYENQLMNEREYKQFLKLNCENAYKEFNTGQTYVITGWTLFSVCIPATTVASFGWISHIGWGTPPDIRKTEEHKRMVRQGMTSFAFIPISFAGFVASIPLLTIGYKKKHNSVETFNSQCNNPTAEIKLQMSDYGVGMAIRF